jgi:hypothetical protein
MNTIESLLYELKSLKNSHEGFIYAYFENIKRDVDLRRERLKQEIDQCSDTVLEEIEKLKSEFMMTSTAIDKEPMQINEVMNVDEQLREFKCSLLGKKVYSFEFDEINIRQSFGHIVQKNIGGELNIRNSYGMIFLLFCFFRDVINKVVSKGLLKKF